MNLDERYRCAAHPDTTIGRTPGVDHAPRCLVCGREMTREARGPGEQVRDPRNAPPQRGSMPL